MVSVQSVNALGSGTSHSWSCWLRLFGRLGFAREGESVASSSSHSRPEITSP